ncbi:uncharacterized protein LOC110725609 isoform X1 [Chenopodium quinoa]|uniref:uncharacterized protein LOC110725609 isoform X1 n=1 Tax=Chenopodium quinoa TaxID=63459 RepID=UPI000B783E26|nr:uncharacterized protein LOC110725609 isoform X1 [Chenopodium quinoa]
MSRERDVLTEAATSIPKKKKERTREQPPRKNKKQPLCPSMAMDDFLVTQNQMDPAEIQQIEQDVQQLEQVRQNSKRPLSTIIPLESRAESVSAQVPKKKGRGPSNLFDVHARKWEDRVTIYCNDKGQPIGLEKARKELTRFLGTIAHDYNWAPLTYTNWKKVPNKEKIWEFVNSKYILPVEAKDWVMETLDQSWRGFKCRLKRDHYYMYDTYEERLKHPPERVPEAHYKTLLAYWGTTIAKKTSLQNSENRREQDNIHTNGPVSFAMKLSSCYEKMVWHHQKEECLKRLDDERREELMIDLMMIHNRRYKQ